MLEAEMRAELLKKRRDFAKSEKYSLFSARICANIRALPEYRRAKNVMLYLPLGGEADVTDLLCDGKEFFTPVTHGVEIYPAHISREMKFKKGEYGVAEPENPEYADKAELNFIIVPAVAADKNHNRMGFGKGCYDRFLCGTSATTAAAVFGFQLVARLEHKPHDVNPDYIITEGGCF